MNTLKISLVTIITSLLFTLSAGNIVSAQTTTSEEDLSALIAQINSLLEVVASLQAQLAAVENQANELLDFVYSRNLTVGSRGEDVKQLQKLLNNDTRTKIADKGPDSPGNESEYFGNLTKSAVIKFQELHKDDILKPNGLSKGSGFVGPSTIKKLNSISGKKKGYVASDYSDKKKTDEYEKKYEDDQKDDEAKDEEKDDDPKEDDKIEEDEDKEEEKVDPKDLPIIKISADDDEVIKGSATKIRWETYGIVKECNASGGWDGEKVLGNGSEETDPIKGKTTFTLTCENDKGKSSASVTVDIELITSIPSISFEAEHKSLAYKGDTTLEWEVQNADICKASGDWDGNKNESSGTANLSNLTQDKVYVLECTNSFGTAEKTVEISVGIPSAPIVVLSATSPVIEGNTSELEWVVYNDADSCSASGDWTGSKNKEEGDYTTDELYSTKTYTLSCTNAGGTGSDTETVLITETPPTVALTATPDSIASDGISVLQWSVTNADSCTASGDWSGSKSTSGGSEPTDPLTEDASFTLSCSNEGGSTSVTETVDVN